MTGIDAEQLTRLADTLWGERRLVEFLLYKLTSAKLLLAGDERQFVPAALGEVDQVLAALRDAERAREDAVADIARSTGAAADTLSLSRLATEAPEPYRTVFGEHRQVFLQLSEEIEQVAAANRALASSALSAVNATLVAFNTEPSTGVYDATGHERGQVPGSGRYDQVL